MTSSRSAAGVLRLLGEALRGSKQDYTQGGIGRAVVLLALPMVAEQIMESVFAVVDVFVVSRLGAEAVAAIGITESLVTPVFAVAMGLSMAATALVARRAGEGDAEGAARSAAQVVTLGAILSALLGVSLGLYAPELLRVLGASEGVVVTGTAYARLMLGGNATILLLYLINAIFRGAGDAAVAMRVLWLGNGINIVLAPCLVLGLGPFPALGVTGAAVATNVGRGLAVLVQLYTLTRGGGRVGLRLRHFVPDLATMRRIGRIGATGVLQVTIGTASWLALVRIVADFGSAAVAGYTIGARIVAFAILPCFGLANAAATLVGQNLGAKEPERAERSVWITGGYSTLVLTVVGLVLVAFDVRLARAFSSDAEVLRNAASFLRIVAYGFPFYGIGMVLPQAFNGAGDSWTPTVLNLLCFWVFEIPVAYALSKNFGLGPSGIFWSIATAFSALALVSIVVFRRGRWKQLRV